MAWLRAVVLPGLLASALVLAAFAGARAQQSSIPPGQSADGTSVIELSPDQPGQIVKLAVGKAQLVRLPVDVRDVLVANPDTADVVIKTPRLIYLVGRAVGATNAFFLDGDGNELLRLEMQVQVDVVAVSDTLRQLLPDADIKVTAVNTDLFLTGRVRSPDMSENARLIARRFVPEDQNVVNMLAVIEDQQVLLQVRIAEVSRNTLKELGLNLAGSINNAMTTFTARNLIGALATATPNLDTPYLTTTGTWQPNSGDQLTVTINALERNGLLKTLAEPNLTTVSGEPASFLAGGEFPIPQAADNGQISIVLEPFGVALNFTPVVLNSGRISLRIFTEVSAISNDNAITLQNIQVPSLTVRRAETTVELPSGGSLMMAGLLQDNLETGIRGAPGLKDLPILGPFFRNNSLQRTESELIVAVTCYLVSPISRQQVSLPTDGLLPPSDYDLYFLGRLHGLYSQKGPQVSQSLKGPLGYIVE